MDDKEESRFDPGTLTIALVGWKPVMGSTISPTRWMVSPMCATNSCEHLIAYVKPDDRPTFRRLFHVAGDVADLAGI